MLNSVGEETRTGRMQADLGLDVYTVQDECSSQGRSTQDRTEVGQGGCKTGQMQDRTDAGGRLQERTHEGQVERRKNTKAKKIIK